MACKRVVLPAGGKGINICEVVAAARYYEPHAASRVVHVAMEPRDHVHMKMFDGLARSRTGIEANVKAVRVQLVVKLLLYDVNELEECRPFGARCTEPVTDHTPRDDERVSP